MMDLGAAARVVEARAVFDAGPVLVKGGGETLDFAIPAGATRLVRLEIDWAWGANQQSLVFDGAAGLATWPAAVALVVLVALSVWLLRNRQKARSALSPDSSHDDQQPQGAVRIVSPDDLTCQSCNRAIPLTAVAPAGNESDIRWFVPGDQHQNVSSGLGPQFAVTFSEPGVKQVVAECHGNRDDVLLYVFKTASGRLSLAEVLSCEAPAVPSTEAAYTQYRTRHQLLVNSVNSGVEV
jgi:hypothetical protein